MRPRADLYIDTDDSDDSDDKEVIANQQVINSNAIIRRSITFGPEIDETEEKERTTHRRGIYFLCYQSSIRNGFNFLVTRKSFLSPSPISQQTRSTNNDPLFFSRLGKQQSLSSKQGYRQAHSEPVGNVIAAYA